MNRLIKWKAAGKLRRVQFAGIFVSPFAILLATGLSFSQPVRGAAVQSEGVPGQVWRDTAGNPINAHGGGGPFPDGIYYWYGEFRRGKTFLPHCNQPLGGTRCHTPRVSRYSSTNLY